MLPYIIGVICAFGEVVSHALANIVDSLLSNRVFKSIPNLVFLSQLVYVLLVPVILVLDPPRLITAIPLQGAVVLIAVIEILYQYPYYWSLQNEDTSIVTSLFLLGEISVPLLAFLLVREQLTFVQYIGFVVTIGSSVVLAFRPKTLRFSRAVPLMLLVSIALSLQAVLYKYLFEHGVSWGSALAWTTILEFVISAFCVLPPKGLVKLKFELETKNLWLVFVAQGLTWVGEATGLYALYLIPVSVVKAIGSTQPLVVFLLAVTFSERFHGLFKERLEGGTLKRIVLLSLIVIGTALVIVA